MNITVILFAILGLYFAIMLVMYFVSKFYKFIKKVQDYQHQIDRLKEEIHSMQKVRSFDCQRYTEEIERAIGKVMIKASE